MALSNSGLFLGIEDDGTVTGVHVRHSNALQLAAFIANKTVPPVSARISILSLSPDGSADANGLSVATIEVPRSTATASSTDGKIMRRKLRTDGSPESVPLYPYEIITRLSSLGQLDYSSFPIPDSAIDDLDSVEVQRLKISSRAIKQ